MIIRSFFDPGLWLLGYDYARLNLQYNRWNFPSLAEPFWRMYWINTTGAALRIGKRIMPLLPKCLYVIPPDFEFGSIHRGHCRQLYAHFRISRSYTLRNRGIITLPLTKQRRYFVRQIIACHLGSATFQQMTALLIRAFLETLIKDLSNQYLSFQNIDKRLLNTLDYMEQHMDQPLDNRKIAASMGVHPQTMLRLFKNDLGKSPHVYLQQLRVDKACWLLRFSDDSIKTIAEATGFCDRYHFTKVFTAHTGESPARFRANNKPSKQDADLPARTGQDKTR